MATNLATAYVSIVPTTRDMQKNLAGVFTGAEQQASKSGKRMGSGLGGALMTGAKRAVGVAGLGAAIVGGAALKGGITRLLDIDNAQAKLRGLGYEGKQIGNIMDSVTKAVTGTAFGTGEAAGSAAGALAAGIKPGKELTKYLTLTGDAATQAGTDFNSMALIMNKIQGQGKLTGDTLMQLEENGVPAASFLADALGKPQAKIREMVSEGEISAKQFQKVLKNRIGGAAQESGNTVTGAFKNMQAALGRIGANFLTGLGFGKLPSMFTGITNALAPLELKADEAGKAFGRFVGGAVAKAPGVFASFWESIAPLRSAVAGVFRAVVDAVREIGPAFAQVGRALLPLGKVIATLAIGALTVAFRALGPVIRTVGKAFGALGDFAQNHSTTFRVLAGIVLGGVAAWKAYRITTATVAAVQALMSKQLITTRVGLVALKVQTIATTVATKTAAAATKAWQVITNLTTLAQVRQRIASAAITVAILAQNAATRVAAVGMRLFNAVMRMSPVGMVITALTVLGGALVLAYKKSETFRRIVNGAWAGIKKAASVAWGLIRKVVGGLVSVFGRVIGWLKNNWRIVAIFAGPVGLAVALITKYWRNIWGVIKRVGSLIMQYVRTVGRVYTWLWNKAVQPALSGIGKAFNFLWGKVIKPVMGWIGDRIRNVYRGVIKPIVSVWQSILTGDLGGAWSKLKNLASNAMQGIVTAVKSIPGKLRDLAGMFGKAGKWLIDAFINGLAKTGRFVADIAGNVWDAVKGMINTAIDKINDALEFEISIPGPNIHINPPNIPHLARGGYISKATLAMVGEGREPEAVLPRSVLRSLMRSAAQAGVQSGGVKPVKATGTVGMGLRLSGTKKITRDFDNAGKSMNRTWTKRIRPALTGWDKQVKDEVGPTLVRFQRRTVNPTNKRIGQSFTRLRNQQLKPFESQWGKDMRSRLPGHTRTMETRTNKSLDRVGSTFSRFRTGPLNGLKTQWGKDMRTRLPDSVNTMRSKVSNTVSKTSDRLRSFGKVVTDQVAPKFRTGVDRVGKAWSRVENVTKRPIRYVIGTVLNKGLIGAFNKIAKFVDTKQIKPINIPKGFDTGGFTGRGGKFEPKGIVHGGEYVLNKAATTSIRATQPGFLDTLNRKGAKALPGHARGGFVNPDKRVYLDGEPLSAIHAAQLALASRLSRSAIHVMQGSWQPATSYSGTSHTGPGVADTSPGNFDQQKWQRKVGIAAWGRNFPGAASAGSGAHIHGVSLFSPGAVSQGQRDDYLNGGDGLGGSDYGPRPSMIKNLRETLKRFGPLPSTLGGMVPMLPPWAQSIVAEPKKWATDLLDGGKRLTGRFGQLTQGVLNQLVDPVATWATDLLGTYSGGGIPGGPMPGPKQLDKASPQLAKRYAYGRLKAFGFGKSQWDPLQKLWERESGWRWDADNPSSSAYGIPQSLPGSKMASAGANWLTNAGTQVNWGLGYIKDRYGNPASAWGHSEAHNWYDDGGYLPRGVSLAVNRSKGPEPVFTTGQWQTLRRYVPDHPGQASTQAMSRVALTITNWQDGVGYISDVATNTMAGREAHANRMGRMGGGW